MGDAIETYRVRKYTNGITLLAQQKKSRLRECVRIEPGIVAKIDFFDQIGVTAMREKVSRHEDTPLVPVPSARRAVTMKWKDTADLVDPSDVNQVLNNPAGPMGQSMSAAAGRDMDQTIINNMLAVSKVGEDGDQTAAFPTATHQVAATYNPDAEGGLAIGISCGLNTAKLASAKQKLDLHEAGIDPDEARYIAITSYQSMDLFRNTKYTNADYATTRALGAGELNHWLGFEFKRLELLLYNGAVANDIRSVLAWVKSCQLLGIGKDTMGRAGERADKSYAMQIYYAHRIGATRMDETGTVEILCDQSPPP